MPVYVDRMRRPQLPGLMRQHQHQQTPTLLHHRQGKEVKTELEETTRPILGIKDKGVKVRPEQTMQPIPGIKDKVEMVKLQIQMQDLLQKCQLQRIQLRHRQPQHPKVRFTSRKNLTRSPLNGKFGIKQYRNLRGRQWHYDANYKQIGPKNMVAG